MENGGVIGGECFADPLFHVDGLDLGLFKRDIELFQLLRLAADPGQFHHLVVEAVEYVDLAVAEAPRYGGARQRPGSGSPLVGTL